MESVKAFSVFMIITVSCSLYFNYFIGESKERLKLSIRIFFALLVLSALIMVANHVEPAKIIVLRSLLVGEPVQQSPSGITPWIFSFGFQIAALTTFAVVASAVYKRAILFQAIVFTSALTLLLLGMNRSAFLVFALAVGLFWLLYFRFKTVLIIGSLLCIAVVLKSEIAALSTGRQQNILAKNSNKINENRSSLTIENLKIIEDYPLGIAFSGKTWNQVAIHNPAFRIGETGLVTSHNGYLMFITYLGIVIGSLLLFLIYQNVFKIFIKVIKGLKDPDNALLAALCFSLMAISVNSCFHNESLLAGSGPILFLYFSVLHLSKIQSNEALV
ncbi:O-antigen ligase family protein [Desertivirga arenae]|uniref:O-antigen ligase family protein n=1 Tax=Desertivirga arenae TaxID=2810309 RepID=UPI001A95838B|nr:O-antigen ligase family protein [Pedobacter sp. SYSU D00823]